MFALIAVALAAQERVGAHMREDPSQGLAVLPSGAVELVGAGHPTLPDLATTAPKRGLSAQAAPEPEAEQEAPTDQPAAAEAPTGQEPTAPEAPTDHEPAAAEAPTGQEPAAAEAPTDQQEQAAAEPAPPKPTPKPTPQPTSMSQGNEKIGGMEDWETGKVEVGGVNLQPTPLPVPFVPEDEDKKLPGDFVDPKLKSLAAVAGLGLAPPPPTLLHREHPTPTLDGTAPSAANTTDDAPALPALAPYKSILNMTPAEKMEAVAKIEADRLSRLTLAEAAGAVLSVITDEPRRVLSDVESFLLELKRALVGPPMHYVMRDAAEVQNAMALQDANGGRPTGETEYVVSVNGIMEYRPPTAHGAVRVVSVLLLLASAIVLGIGWRYGSAPGMYPYVEDCRL